MSSGKLRDSAYDMKVLSFLLEGQGSGTKMRFEIGFRESHLQKGDIPEDGAKKNLLSTKTSRIEEHREKIVRTGNGTGREGEEVKGEYRNMQIEHIHLFNAQEYPIHMHISGIFTCTWLIRCLSGLVYTYSAAVVQLHW